jgi:transposase-like protein
LLTKAIGLRIGKRALDLSAQNSVVCTPLPGRSKAMVERVKLDQRGQPTKYNADIMPNAARFLAQRGAIMCEIAAAFKVSTRTIYNWMNQHPEFQEALHVGVDTFNDRVEHASEKAIGFWVTTKEEVRGEDGKGSIV